MDSSPGSIQVAFAREGWARIVIWIWQRNPFAYLDDLPDAPPLARRLLVGSIALVVVRLGWLRLGPSSFQKASTFFLGHLDFLCRNRSQDDLGNLLFEAALICAACGSFIFFRRAVWWWQQRRESKEFTGLDLK